MELTELVENSLEDKRHRLRVTAKHFLACEHVDRTAVEQIERSNLWRALFNQQQLPELLTEQAYTQLETTQRQAYHYILLLRRYEPRCFSNDFTRLEKQVSPRADEEQEQFLSHVQAHRYFGQPQNH
jgi:hypothetical protein